MYPGTLFLCLLFTLVGHSVSAQTEKDTTIIYYNKIWMPISEGTPYYIGIAWPENGKYHKQDYFAETKTLYKDGFYEDKDFNVPDGTFTMYNRAGAMTDSFHCVKGLSNGAQFKWDDKGNNIEIRHWSNGIPVDTAFGFRADGSLSFLQVTDSMGNGFFKQIKDDGRTVNIKGRLEGGKRTGSWTYKDKNGIIGTEVIYEADSIIVVKCFDEKGLPKTKGECVLERPAEFYGGAEGWRLHLERNLHYPEEAQRMNIQGVVRVAFSVDKDGTVIDLKVLSSPHQILSDEALRIIKLGKWTPAMQYNRPVIYKLIQNITFRLQ